MKKSKLNPDYFYQKIKIANWEGQLSVFSDNPEEIKVHIRPDKSVLLGKFKPDPLIPGGWIAHSETIKALREEIFVGGFDLSDTELFYQCQGCQTTLDLQFWKHCPFCLKSFPDSLDLLK
jgi:hypothetical protein